MDGGDPNCRHVDIVCIDTSLLSCLSCGAIGSIEPTAPPSRPNQENVAPTLTSIPPLTWPASVSYLSSSSDGQVEDALLLAEHRPRSIQATNVQNTQNAPDFKSNREAKPFVYKPLVQHEHIRLLDLSPGSRAEALRGQLRVVGWSESHPYGALSYTWADAEGDASLCRRIFLDDTYSPLPITLSCDRALRSLRKKDSKITIWVDAICINQWSHIERSHQVSLMHHIYSMAKTVHIYVGEVEHGADKAGDQSIAQLESFEASEAADLFPDVVSLGTSFTSFFARPYFSRLWVVQEVLLARSLTLHCGELAVQLSRDTITRIEQKGVKVPSWIGLIARVKPGSKIPSSELISLLLATSDCCMSDLRDKIFGLLGLVEDTDVEMLNADYDLMVREVYIGVATYLLQNRGCHQILEIAGTEVATNLRETYGIPSWVPLWNSETTVSGLDDTSLQFSALENDFGMYSPVMKHTSEFLRIKGAVTIPENPGAGVSAPFSQRMQVHAGSGCLVTLGYTVIELGNPLLRPIDSDGIEGKIKSDEIITDFYDLDGGAVLAIRARPWALTMARLLNQGPFYIIGVLGCESLFLATKSKQVGHPIAYELCSSCVVALIHDVKNSFFGINTALDDLRLMETCYPLERDTFCFLVQWRYILNSVGQEKAVSKDIKKALPNGRQWDISDELRNHSTLWNEYFKVQSRDFSSLVGEVADRVQPTLHSLLEFWDQEALNSARHLCHAEYNLTDYRPDFKQWCRSRTILGLSAKSNFAIKRFSPSSSGQIQWSQLFKSALETWRDKTNLLAGVFAKLPGVDFFVINEGGKLHVTPEMANKIYDDVQSYLSEGNDEEEIIRLLSQTPLIASANWVLFDQNFETLCSAITTYDKAERMVLGRKMIDDMLLGKRKLAQVVFV
ncbi:heterokaryon incompatibility protein-domain-containing protein [Ilyonectria destructans]|nr:heterokaryon incompatibility protein-domain-containing protein [Ilyonectria destructans]